MKITSQQIAVDMAPAHTMASRPSKKRKLAPPRSEEDEGRSNVKAQKAFFKNAASWDLEQDYETKARKGSKKQQKESTRLPVKTSDGRWESTQVDDVPSDEEWLEAEDVSEPEPEEEEEPAEEAPKIPVAQQIREAKEELAKIATAVQEDPEENAGAFKALAKIAQSRVPAIVKLALATQLHVYKDTIPGYRIRPVSEEASQEKLSKEVRKLRAFEQSLVTGYHGYIKELTKHARSGRALEPTKGQTVANVAITCACTLLNAVPHFNFRGDLLKILVGKISTRRVDDDFTKCLQAIQTLFEEDEEGRPSQEAASLISKMMKARDYQVDESVLNTFLHLRLLSEFSGKASKDRVDQDVGPNGKKPKFKKEFRSKRLRKEMKEQKALQKDMEHADALVSHEERDRMQSDTLKLVFASYFRILKFRVPHLMGATLEVRRASSPPPSPLPSGPSRQLTPRTGFGEIQSPHQPGLLRRPVGGVEGSDPVQRRGGRGQRGPGERRRAGPQHDARGATLHRDGLCAAGRPGRAQCAVGPAPGLVLFHHAPVPDAAPLVVEPGPRAGRQVDAPAGPGRARCPARPGPQQGQPADHDGPADPLSHVSPAAALEHPLSAAPAPGRLHQAADGRLPAYAREVGPGCHGPADRPGRHPRP